MLRGTHGHTKGRETYSIPPVVPYDWTQDTSDVMLDIEEMKRQTVWDLASNPPAIAADGAGKEGE